MNKNVFITIKGPDDLITSREETRAGFIRFALEKNRRSTPYVSEAKTFKRIASRAKDPKDLLNMSEIRPALLTASGLSDKALNYLTEADKLEAIKELIQNFLEPEGAAFVDEAVYRFLLIKGDSLGGSMRNIVGILSQQKLVRTLLSVMKLMGVNYKWIAGKSNNWITNTDDDYNIEENMKAIYWNLNGKERVLAFNLKIPVVKNNVDICLFDCNTNSYEYGKIVKNEDKIIMLGELKGGIDPAGADEHWKTANSALNRIRKSFRAQGKSVQTSFIGAAIESNMAVEMWNQLQSGELNFAANLTNDDHIVDYCEWLLSL